MDYSTAGAIEWSVDQAVMNGCTLVLQDLSDVSFIDCSGIGTFVAAAQHLEANSAHLSIDGMSPQVARMMRLTDTDTLFSVCDLAVDGHPGPSAS